MDVRADDGVPAPEGRVTLVFTDVQGSTALWERAPEPMRDALRIHDAVMRNLLLRHDGYEVKTEGDAFMVAFSETPNAVRFCLDAQLDLQGAAWPDDLLAQDEAAETPGFRGLRVRMGVHAGRPECRPDPVTGRMDYFGPVVNRAARVAAAAHGGQVLVSGAVWEAVRDEVEAVPRDLGDHRLKGLEHAEKLVQLLPRDLSTRRFPPVRTLDARKTNLSGHPTSFVGRDADLKALEERFSREARLVTVVGPPGGGKTRLCQRYGAVHLDDFNREGGVWSVDLGEARKPVDVSEAVAHALDATMRRGLPAEQAANHVGDLLAARGAILLLLDPFEHLVEYARATVGQWLRQAPKARFLVASRERLRVEGEACYELGPLPDAEGVALLLERVDQAGSTQELTVDGAAAEQIAGAGLGQGHARLEPEAAVAVVRKVDALPLTIEIQADQIAQIGPPYEGVIEWLPVLDPAGRMRDSILRSWERLEPWEQAALVQCASFEGGFSLDSAERVVDLEPWADAPWILDVLQALGDKSLVYARLPSDAHGEVRFGLYAPIAAFATERLVEAPDKFDIEMRHFDVMEQFAAAQVEQALAGNADAKRALEAERRNFEAAIRRGKEVGRPFDVIERALGALS